MRVLRCRRGFTVMQLILLLGFLAFAFSFALPLIARARQAAAQAQSQNNIRQIMIAVHSFSDTFQRLPPALGAVQQAEGPLFFHILPFVEQQALYQRAESKVWNAGAYSVSIPTYLNPQDKSAPPGNVYKGWLATANYAASWPVFSDKGGTLNDISDGLSNTIGVTERYQMCNGQPNAWGYPSKYYWAPIFGLYSKARFQVAPPQERCNPMLPQSIEASGIIVGMCDGSSRAISERCSSHTWWLAVDPRDNNPLGDDFE